MISLQSIQTTTFATTTNHDFFYKIKTHHHHHHSRLFLRKSRKDSDENSNTTSDEGDSRKQDILARMAMLQAQKVRLTDYLDERSDYLTKFAEDANAEFDQVGENALKELDEASARIMGNIESQMQAFEESSETSKLEIEENQKKLDEFEVRFENERNEGLFFKSLGQSNMPIDPTMAKEEAEKLRESTKQIAGTKTRRYIYLGLIGLISVSLIDSLISQSFDWRKGGILGVILVGLVTQLTYEQKMLAETKSTDTERRQDKKD
ncbi:hypothetical protein LXL04_036061 [Taraxacum kok-saghyz]